MKKILSKSLLIVTFALFSVSGIWAQGMRTPFEKVKVDENGVKQHVYPNPQFGKSSVSLFYGYAPANVFNWWASNVFDTKFSMSKRFASETKSSLGVIGFSYNNQLNPWLELSCPFSYSRSEGEFVDFDMNNWSSEYYETVLSFTPNVKVSWFFNDLVHIYSRVGVGFAICNRYEDFNAGMNGKFALTWQFSPVGVEVGRRVAFFAEAGLGHLGTVSAGLKFRFNRSDVRPDGTKREKREWYDTIVR